MVDWPQNSPYYGCVENPAICVRYSEEIKVYIVYGGDNLHTGFNKTEFDK